MTLSFAPVVFLIFAAVAIVPGIAVLFTRDIVRAAFWLLGSFAGFAGLYLLLDADFLALTQVLVYIGGILILLLFGVMLTHRDPGQLKKARLWGLLGSGIVAGLLVLGAILHVIFNTDWATNTATFETTTSGIGVLLLTQYLLPFEVASVLLLVALVGAAYIARRRDTERAAKGEVKESLAPREPSAAERMGRQREEVRP
jgi:NADH:ubiquinone oxidoreductase subunit 6 (subunit J)